MSKTYIYKGPTSGKTFEVGTKEKPETKNIMFYNGKSYSDLPEDDKYIQSLIRQGFLLEQKEETKAKAAKTKEGSK